MILGQTHGSLIYALVFSQPTGWRVLTNAFPFPSLLSSDLDSFRRQESIFISLNLLILLGLFLLHLRFAGFWGRPAPLLVAGVAVGVFAKSLEWLWLHRLLHPPKPSHLALLTWTSIALNVALVSM